MSVKLHLGATLPIITDGQKMVTVKGQNVSECLAYLREHFPGLRVLFDSEGQLWGDVSVYPNRILVHANPPVAEGDELALVPGIAGG
jgi:molybdopterin converting factor small subunit